LCFPDGEVDCLGAPGERVDNMLGRSDISITGDNNCIRLRFDSMESAEGLLAGGGFMLIVKGNDNRVEMGNVIVRCSPILGMTGLKLIIGQLPGLGPGVSRTARGCRVTIGNRVVINGVTLYLQENGSCVSIGDDSQLSWGVDVWCTDAHTITDLDGNPVNYAHSIEIGRHVWIGKDVKIGKNVSIADNSIVGWGSIVTRRFDEPNVVIAGTPAKVVKHGVNWDRRCIDKYLKER
jgi:acetyltransferase-like isoleucine patch superfamily enzyme